MSARSTGSQFQQYSQRDREVATRIFKLTRVDPHPRRKCLLLFGEVRIIVMIPGTREVLAEDSRDFRRVIRLDNLHPGTPTSEILDLVLNECPYFDEAGGLAHLKAAIEYLKSRETDVEQSRGQGQVIQRSNKGSSARTNGVGGDDEDGEFFQSGFESEFSDSGVMEAQEEVSMEKLDHYIELLYESLEDKVKGARLTQRLTRDPENLVTVFSHDSALNALNRTLREDYKKSLELTSSILSIVLSFATFKDFHEPLFSRKFDTLTLDILEYEMGRYRNWLKELNLKKERLEISPNGSASSGTKSEGQGQNGLKSKKDRQELEKLTRKFMGLRKKQDGLLCVGLNVVRLLSENIGFLASVQKRRIVTLLIETLERRNLDLSVTAITFLVQLSPFQEAMMEMAGAHIVEKVYKFMDPSYPSELTSPLLTLLANLSFEPKLRLRMIKVRLLPQFGQFLEDERVRETTLSILYNISMDSKFRGLFPGSGIHSQVIDLYRKCHQPDGKGGPSLKLIALTLNLASSRKCALAFCEGDGLSVLLSHAFSYTGTTGVALLKVIRKISEIGGSGSGRTRVVEFMGDLLGVIPGGSDEFQGEVIGILGNVSPSVVDFTQLLSSPELMTVVSGTLSEATDGSWAGLKDGPRGKKEALLLEILLLLGTAAADPEAAHFLIQEDLFDLILVLEEQGSEGSPKAHLQILYIIYMMSSHQSIRGYLMERTRVPAMMLGYLRDESQRIRELADGTLNALAEQNEKFREKVRLERFGAHNQFWIEALSLDGGSAAAVAGLGPIRKGHGHSSARGFRRPGTSSSKGRSAGGHSRLSSSANSKSSSSVFTESESSEWSEPEEEEDEFEDEDFYDGGDLNEGDDLDLTHHPEDDDLEPKESKSIFEQFKHQFNQEMVDQERRVFGLQNPLLSGGGVLSLTSEDEEYGLGPLDQTLGSIYTDLGQMIPGSFHVDTHHHHHRTRPGSSATFRSRPGTGTSSSARPASSAVLRKSLKSGGDSSSGHETQDENEGKRQGQGQRPKTGRQPIIKNRW